jgi:hypothetical protein
MVGEFSISGDRGASFEKDLSTSTAGGTIVISPRFFFISPVPFHCHTLKTNEKLASHREISAPKDHYALL